MFRFCNRWPDKKIFMYLCNILLINISAFGNSNQILTKTTLTVTRELYPIAWKVWKPNVFDILNLLIIDTNSARKFVWLSNYNAYLYYIFYVIMPAKYGHILLRRYIISNLNVSIYKHNNIIFDEQNSFNYSYCQITR